MQKSKIKNQNDNAKSKMKKMKHEIRNKLIIREAGYGKTVHRG